MSKLLIDEQPLQVLPSLAREIGLNEAIFLQQLHYWLRSSKVEYDGRKWVYNTFEEWHAQFTFWDTRTIQRIVKSLRDLNLIRAEQIRKKEWDSRNYYTIEYDNLSSLIRQLDATDNDKVTLSDAPEVSQPDATGCREHIKDSETTTENTPERDKHRARDVGAVEIYEEIYREQLPVGRLHIQAQEKIEAEGIAGGDDLRLWREAVGDCYASLNPAYNVGKALHFFRQRKAQAERASAPARAGPRQSNVERGLDAVRSVIAKERTKNGNRP